MNLVTIAIITTTDKRTTIAGVTDASHQGASQTFGEVQEVSHPSTTKHLPHPHQILQEPAVAAADLAVITLRMVDFLPVQDKIATTKIISLI